MARRHRPGRHPHAWRRGARLCDAARCLAPGGGRAPDGGLPQRRAHLHRRGGAPPRGDAVQPVQERPARPQVRAVRHRPRDGERALRGAPVARGVAGGRVQPQRGQGEVPGPGRGHGVRHRGRPVRRELPPHHDAVHRGRQQAAGHGLLKAAGRHGPDKRRVLRGRTAPEGLRAPHTGRQARDSHAGRHGRRHGGPARRAGQGAGGASEACRRQPPDARLLAREGIRPARAAEGHQARPARRDRQAQGGGLRGREGVRGHKVHRHPCGGRGQGEGPRRAGRGVQAPLGVQGQGPGKAVGRHVPRRGRGPQRRGGGHTTRPAKHRRGSRRSTWARPPPTNTARRCRPSSTRWATPRTTGLAAACGRCGP